MTLNAMRAGHPHHPPRASAGAATLLAQKVGCSVVNAGDGAHEHPTQALLDALTIRRGQGKAAAGWAVAICGDIPASRVARSNILSAPPPWAPMYVFAAPSTLPLAGIEHMSGWMSATTWEDALARCRHGDDAADCSASAWPAPFVPSTPRIFPLLRPRCREAEGCEKLDALVTHPGPMNRGVEIASEIADGPHKASSTSRWRWASPCAWR